MEIQTERNSRIAYKHKAKMWKTIAICSIMGWMMTCFFLVRAIGAVHAERKIVTIEAEVVK